MIQDTANPSANMGGQAQGASIDQPKGEPRIPQRVDAGGEPMPGHRLDQPKSAQGKGQEQEAPEGPGILRQALPILAPAIAMGAGAGVALWFGLG